MVLAIAFVLFLVAVRLPWVWWWESVHRFSDTQKRAIDAQEVLAHQHGNCDTTSFDDRRRSTKLVIYGVSTFVCFVYVLTCAALIFTFQIKKGQFEYSGIGAWGPVGDFFGGMLNPILAFASFIALLFTIRIQSEELRLTRREFEKSVEAQKEMVDSHDLSVKVQSETASLNRSIAEFEYLSSMLQSHLKACSFLLYEYSRQVRQGAKGDGVVVNENLGLWYQYATELQALKEQYGRNATVRGSELSRKLNDAINHASLSLNLDTLRKDMILVGNLLNQLKNNAHFSSHADTFSLEFRRAFLIVYVTFKLTDFAGYTYDPMDYLTEQNITFI